MAVSRRFLNLAMKNSFGGTKVTHCFTLVRQVFCDAAIPPSTVRNGSESVVIVDRTFPATTMVRRLDLRSLLFSNPAASTCKPGPESEVVQGTTEAQTADAGYLKNKLAEEMATKMKLIDLPSPIFTFETRDMPLRYPSASFPLTDGKVVITDSTGVTALLDVDTGLAAPMPKLNRCKKQPVSLFVPTDLCDTLYIFESFLNQQGAFGEISNQFEAIVCHRPDKLVYCEFLPPPPFLQDSGCRCLWRITAYTVVGSDICISVEQAGTYRLDTCSNTWHKLGDWTLPFCGKVHYVPELNLWFGISAEDRLLASADLSAMDSQPQLVDIECPVEFEPPEGWLEADDSQLVNLGSGRFCIVNFLEHESTLEADLSTETKRFSECTLSVFTGVEVKPPVFDGSVTGSEKVKLEIRQHKSVAALFDSEFIAVH